MKKLIGTVVVLGLIGGGGWYLYKNHISAEGRTCGKLVELCGERSRSRGAQSCEEDLAEYEKMVGEKSFDRAVACVGEAESCMGAAGCMVGGGMGGLGQFLRGMVKGFEPGLEETGEALRKQSEKLGKKMLERLKRSAGEPEDD